MQAARKRAAEEAGRPKRPDKALRVARTPVGWGVFARRRYQADQVIGEVGGTIIDDPDYGSPYCMDFGDDRCLEPSPPFRFMNHSCEPNCRFTWYDVTDAGESEPTRRMFVLALDEIRPGDELTIDYNWPARMAIPCLCHAPSCRGWVVGEDELSHVVAQRGLGTVRTRENSEQSVDC
jgi:hypothetical protein